ncbi:CBS domain-containing protein [Streptosporangium sp. NPDC051022]|uniref:CBS domain-containing protein n=1 Tax=Streptosporangium sp. NPDC051022 TaxID=3155752 RepID=UPI0034494E9D
MHVTVKDVMTRRVVSVGEETCFKDIAGTLLAHAVSAVPVLDGDGHVVGVVSEADLLRTEECGERFRGGDSPPGPGKIADRIRGEVARELMTAPAVTVPMDASVVAAGRLMERHGVKRLPVLDGRGRLTGIVSRHDLLKVFVRSDADIEREVRRDVLTRSLWMDTARVRVSVVDGVVTLSGRMTLRKEAWIAVRMIQQVNGVVDVIDELACDQEDTTRGQEG